MAEKAKSRFELSVDLVKALAWPVVSMIALLLFLGPLRSTARQLPDLVSRSDSISIGSLSLEIKRGLQNQASPEIKEILKDISPETLRELIDTSTAYYSFPVPSSLLEEYKNLIALGLLEELPEDELKQLDEEYTYGIRLTPLGQETQEFLLAVIEELVQEINSAEESE